MHRKVAGNIRAALQMLCDTIVNFYDMGNGIYAPYELEECEEADEGSYEEYAETDLVLADVCWDERLSSRSLIGSEFHLIECKERIHQSGNEIVRLLAVLAVVRHKQKLILKCTVYNDTFSDTLLADLLVETVAGIAKSSRFAFMCISKVRRYRQLS